MELQQSLAHVHGTWNASTLLCRLTVPFVSDVHPFVPPCWVELVWWVERFRCQWTNQARNQVVYPLLMFLRSAVNLVPDAVTVFVLWVCVIEPFLEVFWRRVYRIIGSAVR